jgi:hypothetical protein
LNSKADKSLIELKNELKKNFDEQKINKSKAHLLKNP